MADPLFVTTDMLKWLVGIGRPKTKAELDNDLWSLLIRIRALEATAARIGYATDTEGPVAISGNVLTFRFSDGSTDSVVLPVPRPNRVENWAAATLYLPWNFVRDPATNRVYIVLYAHTSAGSFDAGANDGLGNNYYSLWFDASISFAGLTDVDLSTSPADGSFVRIRSDTSGLSLYDGPFEVGDLPEISFSDLADEIDPAQYPAGLKPTSKTVTLATDGSLTIDLADGISFHVELDQDVSGFDIAGWPDTGVACSFTLAITNTGGFSFLALPVGTLTPGGTIPAISADTSGAGIDRWRISSDDAGTAIYIETIGNDYRAV